MALLEYLHENGSTWSLTNELKYANNQKYLRFTIKWVISLGKYPV